MLYHAISEHNRENACLNDFSIIGVRENKLKLEGTTLYGRSTPKERFSLFCIMI